jgi:hypothetical protein
VRAAEAIAILAVLGGAGAFGLAGVIRDRAQRRRAARAPWALTEESDGRHVTVYAARPGQERLVVGTVAFAAPDFDYRIEELRSEGRSKLAALNSLRG